MKLKKIKSAYKKTKKFFNRYINGTKGAISLFLAILMVPFTSVAGVLVNAGRINSAVAIFDEALCNASNSTLGTYDKFLRERFMLMATSQDVTAGAVKFGKPSSNYTADEFINDLFKYYMETNLKALNNTYDSDNVSATGVYPLADPDILKSSVVNASQIVVPAKMVVDWGSIDDIVSSLTSPFKLLSSFADTLTSAADAVTAYDELGEKEEALKKAIEACDTAKTEYTTAYNDFKKAVKDYNGNLDNVTYWQGEVTRIQGEFDALVTKAKSYNDKIDAHNKTIADLNKKRPSGYKDQVKSLNEKIDKLKEDREKAVPGYDAKEKELGNANTKLQTAKNNVSGYLEKVKTQKTNYYNKIIAFRNKINSTSSAAVAFQNAGSDLISKGTSVVQNTISSGFAIAEQANSNSQKKIKQQNEEINYQIALAEKTGTTADVTHYYNIKQENNSALNNLQNSSLNNTNINTVIQSGVSTAKGTVSGLSKFVTRDLTAEYKAVYDKLDNLAITVNNVKIPESGTKVKSYDHYESITYPVSANKVTEIVDEIVNSAVNNAGWAALKMVVNFFMALFDLKVFYDPNLKANVKLDNYSNIGGLPSTKKGVSYTSQFDKADATAANKNKEMLNSYSDVEVYELPTSEVSTLEQLQEHIEAIKEILNKEKLKLKDFKALYDEGKGIVSCITNLVSDTLIQGLTTVNQTLTNRLLLVGYLSYNTANRTTYSGAGLSGSSFGLPSTEANKDGYLFSGAETEYIFSGKLSERKNQTNVFFAIFAERMLFDIAPVLADATVQAIATSVGSVTFGIGTPLTYILFIALEGFVDTIVLVNGGTIPILKSVIFLSPGGIVNLVKEICSLKLSESVQQTLFEKSRDFAYNVNEKAKNTAYEHGIYPGEQTVPNMSYKEYKEQAKATEEANKISNLFDFDYTKSLQIIMLLFGSTDKFVKRLADIIQMEATYKAKSGTATYNFDLAKSYTYIRAQGNFSSSAFIRLGENDEVNSNNRVLYNGY